MYSLSLDGDADGQSSGPAAPRSTWQQRVGLVLLRAEYTDDLTSVRAGEEFVNVSSRACGGLDDDGGADDVEQGDASAARNGGGAGAGATSSFAAPRVVWEYSYPDQLASRAGATRWRTTRTTSAAARSTA